MQQQRISFRLAASRILQSLTGQLSFFYHDTKSWYLTTMSSKIQPSTTQLPKYPQSLLINIPAIYTAHLPPYDRRHLIRLDLYNMTFKRPQGSSARRSLDSVSTHNATKLRTPSAPIMEKSAPPTTTISMPAETGLRNMLEHLGNPGLLGIRLDG